MAGVMLLASGGQRVEDIEVLRADEGFSIGESYRRTRLGQLPRRHELSWRGKPSRTSKLASTRVLIGRKW